VHLYGPRIGELDGRDYDVSRDYVCDRAEFSEVRTFGAGPSTTSF
jgi:hypothetical protein